MNRSDVDRIALQGGKLTQLLEKHGPSLFTATKDWETPLRSGGTPGCKNEPSDPTGTTATANLLGEGDESAKAHGEMVRLLNAKDKADAALASFIHNTKPVDPDSIERGRVNLVPACIVCSGPAVPIRRGMCLTDYRAWLRADRPDLERFRRMRQRELEAEKAVVHEHEQAS